MGGAVPPCTVGVRIGTVRGPSAGAGCNRYSIPRPAGTGRRRSFRFVSFAGRLPLVTFRAPLAVAVTERIGAGSFGYRSGSFRGARLGARCSAVARPRRVVLGRSFRRVDMSRIGGRSFLSNSEGYFSGSLALIS